MSEVENTQLQDLVARARTTTPPPPPKKRAAVEQANNDDALLEAALLAGGAEAPAPAPAAEVAAAPAAAPAAPKPAPAPVAEKPLPVAKAVSVSDSEILGDMSTLALHEAINAAINGSRKDSPIFKVAALQSGYTAEMAPLAFQEITRLQSSSVDAYAARMKLLRTLYDKIHAFSCPTMSFQDWLKQTAQGDYDTVMYGLYAATYPGDNEFDVRCRHCGHDNKITANVGALARVESDDVYAQIKHLLDPKTDFKGAIQNSLVGHTIQRRLPMSGIIAEIRNPSIQDYLDSVQWFVQAQDRNTGMLPDQLAGAETIRTLGMYVTRLLVPVPGTSNFVPVNALNDRLSLIGRLADEDGKALTAAVDEENTRLNISYQLPDYNCGGCGKKNGDLFLDFEALLFIKLRERA